MAELFRCKQHSLQEMEEDQKAVLQKYYKTIVTTVQHYNVAPGLVSEAILTTEDHERIGAGETNQNRMERLMNIVLNSSKSNVFETFVRILEEDQEDGHTAKAMRKSLQRIRISRRMTKQARAIDYETGPPPVQVEYQRLLGRQNNSIESDSGDGGVVQGAHGGVGGPASTPIHPAFDRSLSAPARTGPDPGASHYPHRVGSFPVSSRAGRCSYWVPENDCDLYFVIVNKKGAGGNHGITLERNSRIGGLTVVNLSSGSMAQSSQLQKLDVIRTVNGENICTKSVQEVEEIIDKAEKRFILGVVRSNLSVSKQQIDLRMKREQGQSYGFNFIWGEEWPRYPSDCDCYVSEISSGELADQLGLKVGDTLVRVNKKSLQRSEVGIVQRVLLPEIMDPKGTILTVERAEFE